MFRETFERDSTGRCMVQLPFQECKDRISKNYFYARSALLRLKQRLDPATKATYTAFFQEYKQKGHMLLVSRNDHYQGHYYIPHHCVIRSSSETTKLRVVFNASAHDKAGVALNNALPYGQNEADLKKKSATDSVVAF